MARAPNRDIYDGIPPLFGHRVPVLGRLPNVVNWNRWGHGTRPGLVEKFYNNNLRAPHLRYFEENPGRVNTHVITPQQWNPQGLPLNEFRLLRSVSVREAWDKVVQFRDSDMQTYHHPENQYPFIADIAQGGLLRSYSINLEEANHWFPICGAVHAGEENEDIGTLELAALTAYCVRRITFDIAHPIPGRHVPIPYQQIVAGHRMNEDNNLRTFINSALRPAEKRRDILFSINLWAPIGATRTRDEQFYLNGMPGAMIRGWGVPILAADGQEGFPINQGEQLFNMDNPPPFRHQYASFTDMIDIPKIHRNNDQRLGAGVFKNVSRAVSERMTRPVESEQVPFTCSCIQITVVLPPIGGTRDKKKGKLKQIEVKGMMLLNPTASKKNCFFAALRMTRYRHAKTTRGKFASQVKFVNGVEEKEFDVKEYTWLRTQPKKIPAERGISLQDTATMQAAANHYQVSFDIINEDQHVLKTVKSIDPILECMLVLYKDHYYIRTDSIRPPEYYICDGCHKRVVKDDHICKGLKKQNLYKKLKLTKNPYLYVVSRHDDLFPYEDLDKEKGLFWYDFETYAERGDMKRKALNVYAVGTYYNGEKGFKHGSVEVCLDYLLEKWEKLTSYTSKTDKKSGLGFPVTHPVLVIAYNGCRFDVLFIMRYVLHSPRWKNSSIRPLDNLLEATGRMLVVSFGEHIKAWDPGQYLIKTPLSKACDDFKVDEHCVAKGVFPHRRIFGPETLDLYFKLDDTEVRGLNNEGGYFSEDKKRIKDRPYTRNNLEEEGIQVNDQGEVLLLDICKKYLEKDVEGLKQVTDKLADAFYKGFGVNIYAYLTISSMAKALAVDRNKEHWQDVFLPKTETEAIIFRASCYGGKVENVFTQFIAEGFDVDELLSKVPQGDRMENGYEFKDHGLKYEDFEKKAMREVDMTSLYPAAMMEQYPIGPVIDFTPEEIAILNDPKSNGREYDRIRKLQYMVNVDFVPPPGLITPILPRHELDGRVLWSNEPGKDQWYTNVYLEIAEMAHYEIKYNKGIYWPSKFAIYKRWMEETYAVKAKGGVEKNAALKAAGKLAGNSTYGTTLTKDYDDAYQMSYCNADTAFFMEKNVIQRYIDFGDDVVLLLGHGKKRSRQSTTHQGSFVLSWAQKKMVAQQIVYNPMLLHNPQAGDYDYLRLCLKSERHYTDTDSFWLPYELYCRFKDGSLKDELGYMKDESKEKGLCLLRYGAGNKSYGCIMLVKEHEDKKTKVKTMNYLYVMLKIKGITERYAVLNHFVDYFDPNIAHPDKIKKLTIRDTVQHNVIKSIRYDFSKVWQQDMTRSLFKEPYMSRIRLDENLTPFTPDAFYGKGGSVPWGHWLVGPMPRVVKKTKDYSNDAEIISEEQLQEMIDSFEESSSGEDDHRIPFLDFDNKMDRTAYAVQASDGTYKINKVINEYKIVMDKIIDGNPLYFKYDIAKIHDEIERLKSVVDYRKRARIFGNHSETFKKAMEFQKPVEYKDEDSEEDDDIPSSQGESEYDTGEETESATESTEDDDIPELVDEDKENEPPLVRSKPIKIRRQRCAFIDDQASVKP